MPAAIWRSTLKMVTICLAAPCSRIVDRMPAPGSRKYLFHVAASDRSGHNFQELPAELFEFAELRDFRSALRISAGLGNDSVRGLTVHF